MKSIPDIFGSMVFNDEVMCDRLPRDVYQALEKTMSQSTHLELEVANVVANAMKDWAVEKGATHFTHWFQPMTGTTAEKHDSFISPCGDGKVIMEFSGKALLQGEPDASSFPSGGLRATFEARGYTVWDITSYAFIKDSTLYVPTAFCSYSGEALDKKTPLLRSMDTLNKEALRILRLFGNNTVQRVISTVGPEQEYFLIDKDIFLKRPDLMYTGRTLLGARPPKGQELDDHYFGSLKPRVAAFMKELDEELWKLGVQSKTRHNEVAPAQHELAPIFMMTNIACDHNQLTMELLKTVADRHDLACLLHEKPFAGINGSGKHNNWSISTDTGINLLEPGDTPYENAQFLLFLVSVLKAVDEYQDLIRLSAANAGNDHRLGANEAPPAIVSVFLGEELSGILQALESESAYHNPEHLQMEIGVTALPHFSKDSTDRNRSSPFAFTGNKFEFRMLGSSFSVAGPNIVLNTAVADVLREFADELEGAADFEKTLTGIIRSTIGNHKRIVFNGNSYSKDWSEQAEKRGLSNLKTTVDALPEFISQKSIDLFTRHHVFNQAEVHSRYELLMEEYCKTIHIEAVTVCDMVRRDIIPAVLSYQKELSGLLDIKSRWEEFDRTLEYELLKSTSKLSAILGKRLSVLENALIEPGSEKDILTEARIYQSRVIPAMAELRIVVDELEIQMPGKLWPYPCYGEILYSVN